MSEVSSARAEQRMADDATLRRAQQAISSAILQHLWCSPVVNTSMPLSALQEDH